MQLDDRLSIDTPEGVSIEVTLAGLGSRFGAAVIDLAIQGVLLLILVFALTLAGTSVSGDFVVFLMGIGSLLVAITILGYYVVFEALNGGRTPGKAAFGIRVASADGRPVTLGAVLLRTLMRLIDFLPGVYAAGAVAIITTPRNQRLGDLVANTVVIRDRIPSVSLPPGSQAAALGWDVSRIGDTELAVIRRFAARRHELSGEARERLAGDIAGRLRPHVRGGEDLDDVDFIVQLLAEKQARG